MAAAVEAGLARDGGEGQLSDVLLASVCEKVRPHRPAGRGAAWGLVVANHDLLKGWVVDQGLTVVKAGELLARRGTVVPERTLHRYALEVLGVGRSAHSLSTSRVFPIGSLFLGTWSSLVASAATKCRGPRACLGGPRHRLPQGYLGV